MRYITMRRRHNEQIVRTASINPNEVSRGLTWIRLNNNDNNAIYLKSNIQCIKRYEFSGLIMIYTILTVDTDRRNRNVIQILYKS